MQLTDEVIDVAEEIAATGQLPVYCSDYEIIQAVAKAVRVPLAENSNCALLAVASFRRYTVVGEAARVISQC